MEMEPPSKILESRARVPLWNLLTVVILTGIVIVATLYGAYSTDTFVLGIVLAALISLLPVYYALFWFFHLGYDFHDQGLTVHRAFSSRYYPFGEIEGYAFHRVRVRRLFEKTPTFRFHYRLSLKPKSGPARIFRLNYTEMTHGGNMFFYLLKREIVGRMENELKTEGFATWTPRLLITLTGLEKEYSGRHSEGVSSSLPYTEIPSWTLRKRSPSCFKEFLVTLWRFCEILTIPVRFSTVSIGIRYRESLFLELYRSDKSRAEMILPCNALNFYPGLEIVKQNLPDGNRLEEFRMFEVPDD